MENIMLTIVFALVLLFLGFYANRLFKLILPEENLANYSKQIRLVRILLFAMCFVAVVYAVLPSAASFGVRLAVFTILSGAWLIVTMLAVIVSQRSKWQNAAIVCFLLSVAYIGYSFNEKLTSSIQFDVSVNDNQLELTGDYSLTVPYDEIVSIELESDLPAVSFRNNGVSMGGKRAGYFKLANGENSFFFLVNDVSPFIHIERDGEIPVFINCSTSEETIVLYQKLSEKLTL
jgi:hypothetical protein